MSIPGMHTCEGGCTVASGQVVRRMRIAPRQSFMSSCLRALAWAWRG